MNVSFSSTKAVSALCVSILIDRGHLSYDDLVVDYWPEFGKHGKDNITIQWILSHMAGLAYIDESITFEDAASNPEQISKLFEVDRRFDYHTTILLHLRNSNQTGHLELPLATMRSRTAGSSIKSLDVQIQNIDR